MNDDLTDLWDRFQSNVHRQLHNASAFVSQTLDEAINQYFGQCLDSLALSIAGDFREIPSLTNYPSAKDNALEGFPESTRPLRTALKSRKRILASVLEELSAKFLAGVS